LKRPRRRLENVTCRAAALSILFISRRSLAIPAVDPSPWTTQALGRREANPRGSPLQSPRASRGGGGGRARSSEANRRCESWCDALGSGDAKGEGSERKGGGEEGKGICSYWQVGINKPSQARPTRLPMNPANKQSIKTRRTKGRCGYGAGRPSHCLCSLATRNGAAGPQPGTQHSRRQAVGVDEAGVGMLPKWAG
jgi:hypothetical protein